MRVRALGLGVPLVIALIAVPLAAEGQQPRKLHRIGFLSYFGCEKSLATDGAFRQGLP